MDITELLDIVSTGETSRVQFKETMPPRESLMREMAAMSNSVGGNIFIGVKEVTGELVGLTSEQVERFDRDISYIADNIRPVIYIMTEVIRIPTSSTGNSAASNILAIHVNEGINKPYKTDKGEIYIKQGSNKRLVTDNFEIMRMFQQSGNLLADEMAVYGTSIDDINTAVFDDYFRREFKKSFADMGLTLEKALKAKRAMHGNFLTLAGLLFFGRNPQLYKPAFTVKLVSFYGNDISGTRYRSKPADLVGTIPELFYKSIDWLKLNLRNIQKSNEFNTVGELEISEVALIELVQNALIHRDYFKNSPIRIMIFDNRVEIISPGRLPNTLTVADLKYGNPIIRNNLLLSYGMKTLPLSGLGSGIPRAVDMEPDIQFVNDVDGEQFKAIIPRVSQD